MTKRTLAIHPFLIAVFPILLLYSRNFHAVEFSAILWPIAYATTATAVAFGALRTLKLDGSRAGLIVSTGLILFFSFGPGVKLIEQLGVGSTPLVREWLTFGVESLVMAGVVALVRKRSDLARSLTGVFNASALALVGFSVFGIASRTLAESSTVPLRVSLRTSPTLKAVEGPLPDVYFLVLDAYGRSDALKRVIGFDNALFLARLEARGFSVATRSTSNYSQTALSLAATLNLGYLDDLAGSRSDDRLPLKRLISDSAVFRAFRARGYRLVTFDSGFDATESITGAWKLGPSGSLGAFPAMILNQTPLWLLLGNREAHEPHQLHRERILKVFQDLPTTGQADHPPTFTFAHVLAPHPPFLFGADGHDCSDREGPYTLNDIRPEGSDEYARRYRDQVDYITRRVEETVCRILDRSKVEPIIIIQGDHGSGSRFNAESDQPNDLFERMTILNAIYLPRACRGSIDPGTTPVNTFRLVFDRCFGTRLGLLPDRNYYSSYLKPYRFSDVTGKVNDRSD